MGYDETGRPVYTERDHVDLEQLRRLGLPFWLAGRSGSPEGLRRALEVGTLFQYCRESGLRPQMGAQALAAVRAGGGAVFTDPLA
ncbi:hypothetical protein [Deinococcus multiflagellatus]|uniref:hypothetical protein n=1 Tax=Deinococcus multiflagellatus TaxID=1656887 RepID=UPI001CCA9D73|nr:hypothetical protein [Deinococcus multiflagellatus]MBZ9716076.1 hypothetical protein [Deinococcus multiflagellatus]